VLNPDYHRRQVAIFMRLSETARHPDTRAALLWLAEEHRAHVELSKSLPYSAPAPVSRFSVTKQASCSTVRTTSHAFWLSKLPLYKLPL
jgi:hypothetical protein